MFTKRITALLGAGGLAAAGFLALAATPAASAATAVTPSIIGKTIGNTHAAGYETSARNFRYIRAIVPVPEDSLDFTDQGLYPQSYIQLSDGSDRPSTANSGADYARANEACVVARSLTGYRCPSGVDWVSYVEIFDNSLNFPHVAHYTPLQGVQPGDGVTFSIPERAGQRAVLQDHPAHPERRDAIPGGTYKTQAYGDIFSHAAVLDDFTDSTGTPIALPPLVNSFNLTTFNAIPDHHQQWQQGLRDRPVDASPVDATSNGNLPPFGTLRAWRRRCPRTASARTAPSAAATRSASGPAQAPPESSLAAAGGEPRGGQGPPQHRQIDQEGTTGDQMASEYQEAVGRRLRETRTSQALSLAAVEEKSAGQWKAVVVGWHEARGTVRDCGEARRAGRVLRGACRVPAA